jgi:hypothetical protein
MKVPAVTMAMADEFERNGQHQLAAIAREYAIDRPRRRWTTLVE